MQFASFSNGKYKSAPLLPILLFAIFVLPQFGFTQDIATFKPQPLNLPVDSISVIKCKRQMMVFYKQKFLKEYKISLGESPLGAKHFKGDRKTPEGLYQINGKSAQSMAHKCLAISYPNNQDRAYARRFGKSTGGDVKIHGILNGYENEPESFVGFDWTWGCIAVTNDEVDELFEHVIIGSNILIQP